MCPERKGRTKRKLAVSRASSSSPKALAVDPSNQSCPRNSHLTNHQFSIQSLLAGKHEQLGGSCSEEMLGEVCVPF